VALCPGRQRSDSDICTLCRSGLIPDRPAQGPPQGGPFCLIQASSSVVTLVEVPMLVPPFG
jgi:hypothetical protein